jgi:hypothetical protein
VSPQKFKNVEGRCLNMRVRKVPRNAKETSLRREGAFSISTSV